MAQLFEALHTPSLWILSQAVHMPRLWGAYGMELINVSHINVSLSLSLLLSNPLPLSLKSINIFLSKDFF